MIKNCTFCQTEFSAKPSSKKQYCSLDCYWGGKKAQNQFECSYCQQTYYRAPAHQARVEKAFCSKKCMGLAERGEANHAWRGGLVTKNCLECGLPFSVKQCEAHRVYRCSRVCQALGSRKEDKKRPRLYNYSFHKRRVEIRERDKNCCRCCGAVKKDNERNLHVHHINYDRKDDSDENLISLCYRCHKKIHRENNKKEEWSAKLSNLLKE